MNIGAMEEVQIIVGIDMRARLQADDPAKPVWVLKRKVQRNSPADRAAHDDGAVESERVHDLEDHRRIVGRGEPILFLMPAGGG